MVGPTEREACFWGGIERRIIMMVSLREKAADLSVTQAKRWLCQRVKGEWLRCLCMTRKNQKSQFFCSCVEPAEIYVSPPTLGGRKGTTRFDRVGEKTWWGENRQLNTSHEHVRRQKFTSPILGVGSYHVKIKPADKHVRTTTEI